MNILRWIWTRIAQKPERVEPESVYIRLQSADGRKLPELIPQPIQFESSINEDGMLVLKNSNLIEFGTMARIVDKPVFVLQNKYSEKPPQIVGHFYNPIPLQPLDIVRIAPGDLRFRITEQGWEVSDNE